MDFGVCTAQNKKNYLAFQNTFETKSFFYTHCSQRRPFWLNHSLYMGEGGIIGICRVAFDHHHQHQQHHHQLSSTFNNNINMGVIVLITAQSSTHLDSHMIEIKFHESLQPQRGYSVWFSQLWLNHARYGGRQIRVAITQSCHRSLYSPSIRPSLAQSAACNEHHHLDLNSYLAAANPPTHPLAPKTLQNFKSTNSSLCAMCALAFGGSC